MNESEQVVAKRYRLSNPLIIAIFLLAIFSVAGAVVVIRILYIGMWDNLSFIKFFVGSLLCLFLVIFFVLVLMQVLSFRIEVHSDRIGSYSLLSKKELLFSEVTGIRIHQDRGSIRFDTQDPKDLLLIANIKEFDDFVDWVKGCFHNVEQEDRKVV